MVVTLNEAPDEEVPEVTFVSKAAGLTVTLECIQTLVVDGKVVKTPGLRAEFNNHRFKTGSKRLIEGLRNLLRGRNSEKWNKKFQEMPSKAMMNKLNAAREKAAKKTAEIMQKEMANVSDEEVQVFDSYEAFREGKRPEEKIKKVEVTVPEVNPLTTKFGPPKKDNLVEGMRDVGK